MGSGDCPRCRNFAGCAPGCTEYWSAEKLRASLAEVTAEKEKAVEVANALGKQALDERLARNAIQELANRLAEERAALAKQVEIATRELGHLAHVFRADTAGATALEALAAIAAVKP